MTEQELLEKAFSQLDNRGAASESTLQQLSGRIKEQTNSTTDPNSPSNKSLSGILKGITTLGGKVGTSMNEVVSFGKDFVKEQQKFTQTIDKLGLSRIPYVGAVATIVEQLEDNIGTFRNLSQNGINFGGRLQELQEDFARLGVSTREYETYLRGNSEALALIESSGKGAITALRGAEKNIDSFGIELQKFGLDFNEINENYFSFLNRNAYAIRFGTDSIEGMDQRSTEYAKSLRRLTALTGQQVDAVQNMVEETFGVSSIQTALSLETGKTRDQFRMVADMMSVFGNEGLKGTAAMMTGFAPGIDGVSNTLFALTPGLQDVTQGLIDTAKKGTMSNEEFERYARDKLTQFARDNEEQIKANAKINAGISLSNSDIAQAVNQSVSGTMKLLRTEGEVEGSFDNVGTASNKVLDGMIKLDDGTRRVRTAFATLATRFYGSNTVQEGFDRATTAINKFSSKLEKATDAESLNDAFNIIYEDILDKQKNFDNLFKGTGGISLEQGGQVTAGSGVSKIAFESGLEGYSDNSTVDSLTTSIQEKMLAQLETAFLNLSKDDQEKYQKRYTDLREAVTKQSKDVAEAIIDAQGDKSKLGLFTGTPGVFGKLFHNFGEGTDATLHGEEAVIPKDSPIGNMLSMMSNDMGTLKSGMKTGANGRPDFGSFISQAQSMGAKYDKYSKENEGAINKQGRDFAKSFGITDEMLDKAQSSSVQSNNSTGKGTSVNNIGGNMATRLDELIRINKDMLEELRNM
jgi:hypothetical protein